MIVLRLAGAEIEIHNDGLTVTRYPQGEVQALPQDNDTYRARAEALGYGADTAAMSREHEVTHHLIAAALGLPHSPTLMGVATGRFWPHWQAEEAAVLGWQRFARLAGVDLLRAVQKASQD